MIVVLVPLLWDREIAADVIHGSAPRRLPNTQTADVTPQIG